MKKIIIGIMLMCLVGSVFADSWILPTQKTTVKEIKELKSNPITARVGGQYVNSMVYVDHIIHMQPPKDIYRCYDIKEHSSGNCFLLKKPINADKLPFNYLVR
jgi:hypothetical protein